MNSNQKNRLENESQIKEEKKLNYRKFWGWGFGLIFALMVVAYFAGLFTFGPPKDSSEEPAKQEEFIKDDSVATATSAKVDSTVDNKKRPY
jgi:hypothetical protein